ASRWRARCCTGPSCCCSTSHSAGSIRPRSPASRRSSASCAEPGTPSCSVRTTSTGSRASPPASPCCTAGASRGRRMDPPTPSCWRRRTRRSSRGGPELARGILAVLRKDLRIEWRTKESLASFAVLGVLLVVIFSVALDPTPDAAPRVAPSVLWATFVFTGLLGIQRGFVLERESDCLGGVLASPLDPAALYLGKFAANVVLLGGMQALVVP